MTQGAYVHKDHESIVVSVDREERLRVPIHNIGSLVCFGNVLCSPFLLGHCAENRVGVSFLTEHGRFLARIAGNTQGNVLLRREQYRRADDVGARTAIARWIVMGKIANTRRSLRRFVNEHHPDGFEPLEGAADTLGRILKKVEQTNNLEVIRGHEGEASRAYFAVFNHLIRNGDQAFAFTGRNRRPPLDRMNALLSFVYTILLHDIRSALEAVGLDPQVGYLHLDHPGRPGLALDLMEEFRSWPADRLCLALVNRSQIQPHHFEIKPSGAVLLNEAGRKTVLQAYQERKQQETRHPYLNEKMSVGIVFFAQGLLLARYLRGDIDAYPPFLMR